MKVLSLAVGLLASAGLVSASIQHPVMRRASNQKLQKRALPPGNHTEYTYDQTIDHFPNEARYAPHVKGTYKQRYYVESKYYKPGGPVFLYLAGEGPIDNDSHLDNSLITHLMQQFNGVGVVLENRNYGKSFPFKTSTTDQLRYYTTEQVIADFDEFARKVQLPGGFKVNAPGTPWITYGGSYPGALSAFTKKTYPKTFWGAIASSATTYGQLNYPEWYKPIQLLGPQDCIASVNDIVDKMDSLVKAGNKAALSQLKAIFGLSALTDIRDFAQTIAFPMGGPFYYPTYSFQEINWNPNFDHQDFFQFCRNVTNLHPPAENVKVDYQLAKYTNGQRWKNLGNYAAYIKAAVLPLCDGGDYNAPTCFGTQHPDWWANITSTDERSYLYNTCTEGGAYQAAMPYGQKSLLSRVIQTDYTQQWCNWAFPKGKYNTIPKTPDLDRWNKYGGYDVISDRLLHIDGSADVWRDLCYHSTKAPQRYWTDENPEHLINGAGHVWDLRTLPDITAEPDFIREGTYLELRAVEMWLDDFKGKGGY